MNEQATGWSGWIVPPRTKLGLLIFLADILSVIVLAINPLSWIGLVIAKRRRRMPSMWLIDGWLVFLLVLGGVGLANARPASAIWTWPGIAACYLLLDQLGSVLREFVISPRLHSGKIRVRNRQRWLLATAITLLHVVLGFAILFRIFGLQFKPIVSTGTRALYLSMVTFTTLGYGDIQPTSAITQRLIVLELLYFLMFLALKIPLAIGMLRSEEVPE